MVCLCRTCTRHKWCKLTLVRLQIMESGGKVESKTSMDHQAMRDALKSMEEKHDMVFKEYHEIEARKKAEEDARPACSVKDRKCGSERGGSCHRSRSQLV